MKIKLFLILLTFVFQKINAQDSLMEREFSSLFEDKFLFLNEGPYLNNTHELNMRLKFDSAALDFYSRLEKVADKGKDYNILLGKSASSIFLNHISICLLQLDTAFSKSVTKINESVTYSQSFFLVGKTYEAYFKEEFDRYKITGDTRNEFFGYMLYIMEPNSKTYKKY